MSPISPQLFVARSGAPSSYQPFSGSVIASMSSCDETSVKLSKPVGPQPMVHLPASMSGMTP